ncbi:COQ9 family protein [Benzoatithermus flavus]|uniref:COQ9 family protein n=1 Tax=Benzoatithermus flavus TaxID=3108223 RepID=A0ABU8XTQ9_9PROT
MTDAVAERRALKDRVLEAALLHAAFDGWSRRTLINAAADAGLDPATARRLFPQGGDSLLAWLDDWADRRMLEAVSAQELERLPVRRRIALLVRTRLELLAPHREAMRRAAVAHGFPTNVAEAGRALWRTVDRMWQAAGLGGEPAEGFSYYSRRASLAAVLIATFLYWLEDHSEGSADTWAFLDRRIEDVMRIGRARSTFDRWTGWLTGRRPAAHAPR